MALDNDTNLGGTLNIQGASGWAAAWLTYEFVHALNPCDSAGSGPSQDAEDEVLSYFMLVGP